MDANKTKPTACAPENSSDKTSPSVSACEPEPAAPRAPQVDHRGEPHGAKGKMRAPYSGRAVRHSAHVL